MPEVKRRPGCFIALATVLASVALGAYSTAIDPLWVVGLGLVGVVTGLFSIIVYAPRLPSSVSRATDPDIDRPASTVEPATPPTTLTDPFPDGAPRNLVVGESYYTEAFKKLTKGKLPRGADVYFSVQVKFERQPDNPHDANAIKAMVKNQLIGHLPAKISAVVSPKFDREGVKSFELPGVIHAFMDGAKRAFACHVWVSGLGADLSGELNTLGAVVHQWRPDSGEIRRGLD